MPKKRPERRKKHITFDEERTILAHEQTILSKERTVLSFMRTGLTFIVMGLAIVSISGIVGDVLLSVQAVGWVIVIIGFAEVAESYRRLRIYQNKIEKIEKKLGKDV